MHRSFRIKFLLFVFLFSSQMNASQGEVVLNQEQALRIDYNMSLIASSINKSLSGALNQIERPNEGPYRFDHQVGSEDYRLYQRIHNRLRSFDFQGAYDLVFKHKMGDCWEQSMYLGLLLKTDPTFPDAIHLVQVDVRFEYGADRQEATHSFLALILSDNPNYEMSVDLLTYSDLLNRDDVILLDAWRNRVFAKNLDLISLEQAEELSFAQHPLSYVDDLNFDSVGLRGTNLRVTFLDFTCEFGKFHGQRFWGNHPKMNELHFQEISISDTKTKRSEWKPNL